jgi:hypothetical protein
MANAFMGKSIFVGSFTLHFHPSLFLLNMAFDAGPMRRGHFKISDHLYKFFGLHQKSGDHVASAHNKAG